MPICFIRLFKGKASLWETVKKLHYERLEIENSCPLNMIKINLIGYIYIYISTLLMVYFCTHMSIGGLLFRFFSNENGWLVLSFLLPPFDDTFGMDTE